MALGALRTKNLDAILKDAEHPEMSLNRTLGATDIVMLGIGAIIGAGIFSTVGTAAAGDLSRPGAGAALTVSFIITAVVCGFTALCYAEFASMVRSAGRPTPTPTPRSARSSRGSSAGTSSSSTRSAT
jgi:APA family basic amino acid/polyamine antiporter